VHRLISVEGVKYTTARLVAERAVDRVFEALGAASPACRTGEVPLAPPPVAGTLEAAVARATREEMAVKLADIVFRRTALGTTPGPRRAVVEAAARLAAVELGWDAARQEAEIAEVMHEAAPRGQAAGVAG
jgi:glycerol-3-phosphate dehydrogenase